MKKTALFKAIPSIESVESKMPPKRRPPPSRHVVCACCSSWIQFDTSGCTKSWAEMSKGACAFTCKGCRQAAGLVGELRYLRQMMDSLKRMITGQGLEEEIEETGDQVAGQEETEEKEKCERGMTPGNILTEDSRKGKETAERSSAEDRGTDIEMEGEHGTEEEETGRQLLDGKGLLPGTKMLATHSYKKNPNGPVGNELDLMEGDTLVYLMEHDDNESWWLDEDVKGQVGYVPAAYLMVILDETQQEVESRKEGHDKRTDGTNIGGEMGQDGERRKSYSAAVIDGRERTDTIYVGDSIVRKTDRSLNKGKDVVVCLPGARIEHVTERVKKIMGRGNGGSIVVHVGTNNADREGTTAILEKYRDLLKKTKQARVGQIIISGILPVFGNNIQGYRNSKRLAVNGMVKRLCKEEDVGYLDLWDSFVGNEDMYVRDGLHLSGKGAAVFAEGLSGAVASGLGKVRYLN